MGDFCADRSFSTDGDLASFFEEFRLEELTSLSDLMLSVLDGELSLLFIFQCDADVFWSDQRMNEVVVQDCILFCLLRKWNNEQLLLVKISSWMTIVHQTRRYVGGSTIRTNKKRTKQPKSNGRMKGPQLES